MYRALTRSKRFNKMLSQRSFMSQTLSLGQPPATARVSLLPKIDHWRGLLTLLEPSGLTWLKKCAFSWPRALNHQAPPLRTSFRRLSWLLAPFIPVVVAERPLFRSRPWPLEGHSCVRPRWLLALRAPRSGTVQPRPRMCSLISPSRACRPSQRMRCGP